MQAVALEPVDAVTVTILVDNVSDMLLEDQGPARRVGDAGRPLPYRPLGLFEEGETEGWPPTRPTVTATGGPTR